MVFCTLNEIRKIKRCFLGPIKNYKFKQRGEKRSRAIKMKADDGLRRRGKFLILGGDNDDQRHREERKRG